MTRHYWTLARYVLLVLLLGAALAPARLAQAAPLIDLPPWPGGLIPHGITGGSVFDISVSGTTAYMLQGLRLVTLDASDPDQPRRVGELLLPQPPLYVTAANGFAYVRDGTGVRIIDARNPASPTLAGYYPFVPLGNTSYTSMAIIAGYLYVYVDGDPNNPRGVHVVDVRNPASPKRTSVLPLNGVSVIKAAGSLGYITVAGSEARLHVLDLANPAAPVLRGSLPVEWFTSDLTVVGSTVLLCELDRLRLISVANPAAPVEVGRFPLGGRAYGIVRDGNRAYVTTDNYEEQGALKILDVQNPAAPQLLGSLPLPRLYTRVPVRNNIAYLSTGNIEPGTLRLVDLTDPVAPVSRGSSGELGPIEDIAGSNSLLVALTTGTGQSVLWTLAPGSDDTLLPRGRLALAGQKYFAGRSGTLDTDGAFAYVALTNWISQTQSYETLFQVVDLADPAAPAARGTLSLPGVASDIHLSGQLVFAGIGNQLAIIDVSKPDQPALVGSQTVPDAIGAVTVDGTLAYLLTYNQLLIFDVSTPASPALLGSTQASFGNQDNDLVLDGGYLYHAQAARSSAGFYGDIFSYDVRDPSTPVRLDNLYKPNPFFGQPVQDLELRAGTLIASTPRGMVLVDIRNPEKLQLQSGYWGPPAPSTLAMAGSQLYISYGNYGLSSNTLLEPRIWLPQIGRKQ